MAAAAQLRFWVDMALECVRRDHTNAVSAGDQRGPYLTARALGMALGALHDANVLATGLRPALLSVPSPAPAGLAGGNPIVAAAAACHQVLLRRYPKQRKLLTDAWATWTELNPFAGTAVVEAGARELAEAVHAFGELDCHHAEPHRYEPDGLDYSHVAPPSDPDQGYAGGRWGRVQPLVAPRPQNFPPPPGRISAATVIPTPHYAADLAKVAAKGIAVRDPTNPAHRTLEEEITGIYWGYDGPPELGTPPRLYLQVALAVLDQVESDMPGVLDLDDELAVIAATAVAMADAGIHAWFYKYSPDHMMWRPAVGIPKAVAPKGTPVPGWEPLGRPDTNGKGVRLTPNFPAYPSGHATFGAAAFQVLRLFLAERTVTGFDADGVDDVAFDFVSDEYDGRNSDPRSMAPRPRIARHHESLWQAIVDNSISRVFLGVHWQFDGITIKGSDPDGEFGMPRAPADLGRRGGVWLGAQIANAIAPKLGVSASTIAASRL